MEWSWQDNLTLGIKGRIIVKKRELVELQCMNAFWPVYGFASLCLKFESPGMLSQVLINLPLTGKTCSPLWALLQEIIYRCHMVSRQCFTGKVADVMKFLGGLSSIWLLLMAPPLYDTSTGMGFLESVLEFP